MSDRLVLVRHGESTWNAEQGLQGQLDPPLSALGREQARALATLVATLDAESDELTNWRGGPRTAPDGEPWHAFAARVADAVNELAAAGGSWLVICHGGCIRAACAHLTGADALALAAPPNASATSFELGARPHLLRYGTLPDGRLPTGLY